MCSWSRAGEAEIGFYPKSEVVNTDGLTVVGPLPAAIQLTTIYGAAVTADQRGRGSGAAFIAFMADPAHRAAWTARGLRSAKLGFRRLELHVDVLFLREAQHLLEAFLAPRPDCLKPPNGAPRKCLPTSLIQT